MTSLIVFPCSRARSNDLVVDVRQVHDLTHLPSAKPQRAPQQILEQERAKISEVRRDCRPSVRSVYMRTVSPSAGANGSIGRVIVLYRRNSDISLGVDSERTRSAQRSVNAIVNRPATQLLELMIMSFLSHATLSALALTVAIGPANAQQVEITADAAVAKTPVTGRLFVFFSSTPDREPRLQGGAYGGSVPFFGLDVEQWRANTPAVVDAKVLGFPFEILAHMPAGDYYAQAMLDVYTQFHRADGHMIWVHADQWEGQHWNTSPGNLVSEVQSRCTSTPPRARR